MASILFAVPRFHTNLWFAVRAMLAEGHRVTILANGAGQAEDHSLLQPVVMGKYPDQAAVTAAVRNAAPDIVFVRNAFALSRRAARAARRLGIPAMLYNLLPADEPTGTLRWLDLWWKGQPAHRITPVKGLSGRTPEPYATYLPWPVGQIDDAPRPPRPDGPVRILCVGKIGTRRKNQILLIETLERAGLTDRVHLTLAGTTPNGKGRTEHRQDVADAARRDWVTLVPPKPFREMPALFRAADICILPSFAEPLGVAPVEAMAYGTLPMISEEAGSAGYLQGTDAGHIIDMTRPETLIDPLKAMLEDPALLARGQAQAAALAAGPLGEARFIQNLHALLQRHGVTP